tara:strand:+ start:13378 stop:13866 length:489 start_codon:yes stop_codon:yes gene_type:complete
MEKALEPAYPQTLPARRSGPAGLPSNHPSLAEPSLEAPFIHSTYRSHPDEALRTKGGSGGVSGERPPQISQQEDCLGRPGLQGERELREHLRNIRTRRSPSYSPVELDEALKLPHRGPQDRREVSGDTVSARRARAPASSVNGVDAAWTRMERLKFVRNRLT